MTDRGARDEAGSVFHLMYRSHSTIPDERRKQELGVLFGTARSTNKARGITGALLCVDDCFVQVLEGEEAAVQSLFEHIARDDRHDDVAVLETGKIPERVFSRWAMAKVAADGEPDIPLIAHRDGIAPAAGRRTTPEQDRVLDVMRDAARAEASKG